MPTPTPTTTPPRETTSSLPAAGEASPVAMIDLADRLATALRVLKGDTRLAMWLFDHAGGAAAAQTFVEQARLAQANPDNPLEQARVLDLAPSAAQLLEAAIMLRNVLSAFGTDDEAQADAADLDPVTRP
jgi:hypothetical protein